MRESFTIRNPMQKRLEEANKKTGLSKSEIIRQALYKHLKTIKEVEKDG